VLPGICWPWSDPDADFLASAKEGIDQVGCVYTAQGFEFDYVGVICGPDWGNATVSHAMHDALLLAGPWLYVWPGKIGASADLTASLSALVAWRIPEGWPSGE